MDSSNQQDQQQIVAQLREENTELRRQLGEPDLKAFEQIRELRANNKKLTDEFKRVTGECVQLAFKNRQTDAELKKTQSELAALNAELDQTRSHEVVLGHSLEDLRSQLSQSKEVVFSHEAELERQKEELARRHEQMENLRKELEGRESRISNLETLISEFKEQYLSGEYLTAEAVEPSAEGENGPYKIMVKHMEGWLGFAGATIVDQVYDLSGVAQDSTDASSVESVFEALQDTAAAFVQGTDQHGQLESVLAACWQDLQEQRSEHESGKSAEPEPAAREESPHAAAAEAAAQALDALIQDDPSEEDSVSAVAHEESTQEDTAHEEPTHEEAAHVEPTHEEAAHVEPAHEEPAHEEVAPEEPAHEEVAHVEPAHEEVAHEEVAPAQEEVAHEEVAHEEVAQEEPAHEEVALEEPAHEEVALEEPAHEEVAHEEPAHEEVAHEEPAHEEVAHEEPAHEEVAHEEPAHEEIAHEEPVHEEVAPEEPAHEEVAHEEPAHEEVAHEEVAETHHDTEAVEEAHAAFAGEEDKEAAVAAFTESAEEAAEPTLQESSAEHEAPATVEEHPPAAEEEMPAGVVDEVAAPAAEESAWSRKENHILEGLTLVDSDPAKALDLLEDALGMEAWTGDEAEAELALARLKRGRADVIEHFVEALPALVINDCYDFLPAISEGDAALTSLCEFLKLTADQPRAAVVPLEGKFGVGGRSATRDLISAIGCEDEERTVEVLLDHIYAGSGLKLPLPSPRFSARREDAGPAAFVGTLRQALRLVDYTLFDFQQLDVVSYDGADKFIVDGALEPNLTLMFHKEVEGMPAEEVRFLAFRRLVQLYRRYTTLSHLATSFDDAARVALVRSTLDVLEAEGAEHTDALRAKLEGTAGGPALQHFLRDAYDSSQMQIVSDVGEWLLQDRLVERRYNLYADRFALKVCGLGNAIYGSLREELAATPDVFAEFEAKGLKGLFESTDSGLTAARLRVQRVWAAAFHEKLGYE